MKQRREIKKMITFDYNLGMDRKKILMSDEDTIFNTLCLILEEHYLATEPDVIEHAVYEYMEENNLIGWI